MLEQVTLPLGYRALGLPESGSSGATDSPSLGSCGLSIPCRASLFLAGAEEAQGGEDGTPVAAKIVSQGE